MAICHLLLLSNIVDDGLLRLIIRLYKVRTRRIDESAHACRGGRIATCVC